MIDVLENSSANDNKVIDIDDTESVNDWCANHGVSEIVLMLLIDKVGTSKDSIKKELSKMIQLS